ncbi:MAG: hypothetical protein CVV27_18475 [Candidatus Melainabacteria bacterium HGW-Melainabacteria-1]|nr:MAG: hypothetical protein CVV27_18475 [Candidatus Melainabacteria bacterium HGW-Melainabacteria-1]
MLHQLSILTMLATLALMSWSLIQGRTQDALYQFFLGSAVALLLRRFHETGNASNQADAQDHNLGHHQDRDDDR